MYIIIHVKTCLLILFFSFYQARDVYEEAILTVVTVRDFTQVFDSYGQFEENMIAAKMETNAEMGQDEEGVCGFSNVGITLCSYFFCIACLSLCPLIPR